ncbi:MAG: MmcQ/YjbR family DNA-binding protein [Clostridia bacterium]|nr:MmcQ/YjbR family DNA-binding protein [Clostridia bacterium]
MTEKEIIDFCLTLDNTFDDRPFQDDLETVVLKHSNNKKWFALIMKVKEKIYLNVKSNPEYSELLRNTYKYIIPAYHMNKQHWNTIIVSEKVDSTLVKELLKESYDLTKSKNKK